MGTPILPRSLVAFGGRGDRAGEREGEREATRGNGGGGDEGTRRDRSPAALFSLSYENPVHRGVGGSESGSKSGRSAGKASTSYISAASAGMQPPPHADLPCVVEVHAQEELRGQRGILGQVNEEEGEINKVVVCIAAPDGRIVQVPTKMSNFYSTLLDPLVADYSSCVLHSVYRLPFLPPLLSFPSSVPTTLSPSPSLSHSARMPDFCVCLSLSAPSLFSRSRPLPPPFPVSYSCSEKLFAYSAENRSTRSMRLTQKL